MDNKVGTTGNDTFIAGDAFLGLTFRGTPVYRNTLTAGDTINGGSGNDTLQVNSVNAVEIPSVTAISIETLNVNSSSTVNANASTWADTTSVRSTSIGGATVTASATADVTVRNTDAAGTAQAIEVNGGKAVSVTAANNILDTVTVGAEAAAAGAVTVTSTGGSADGNIAGAIAVTGGTSVTVNQFAGNAAATGVNTVGGSITVTGNASTTAVNVNQTATADGFTATTRLPGVVGYTAGIVNINDAVAGLDAAGTIATVTLNNYGPATIDSSAISTVNLSGTGGPLTVSRGGLVAVPTANTLTLNTTALTGGPILDDEAAGGNGFKTINLANSGTTVIGDLTAADLTTLNISGSGSLTLTANPLGGATTTAIVNTSTGNVTLGGVLDVATAYTGGAGVDTISVGASTKAINLGGGNDVLTITAVPGTNGTFNGGTGTNTIVANMATSSLSASTTISNFQTLRAGAAAAGAHSATGFTSLEVGAIAGDSSFTGVAAGVGLTQLATLGKDLTVTLANATGAADSFTLTLSSAGAIGAAADTIRLDGVETVNVRTVDTDATAHVDAVALIATSAKTVNVSGNAGLVYSEANASITSFNASGVVLAAATATGVTFDSTNTTVGEVVSITGSNGVDALTGSATANDTISAGAGADRLVFDGGLDVFTGGSGVDIFDVNAAGTSIAYLTIADFSVGDQVDLVGASTDVLAAQNAAAMTASKVVLGAAATFDQYLAAAANQDGSTNAALEWFNFGGNTYLVVSNDDGTTGASAGYTSGTDTLVKLTGTIDLSASNVTAEVLTLVAVA
jgi:S-layer protein